MQRMRSSRGMTLTEVVVAVVILAASSTALFQFLRAGDILGSRALRRGCAAHLAQNEMERLKTHARESDLETDSTYETEVAGITFRVERHGLDSSLTDAWGFSTSCREVEIRVALASTDSTLVRLRTLQRFESAEED